MLSAHRAQKMMLELEQQTLGSCKVDAGNIPGPLQEQQVLFTAEPSLLHLNFNNPLPKSMKGRATLCYCSLSPVMLSLLVINLIQKRFIQIMNHHILFKKRVKASRHLPTSYCLKKHNAATKITNTYVHK